MVLPGMGIETGGGFSPPGIGGPVTMLVPSDSLPGSGGPAISNENELENDALPNPTGTVVNNFLLIVFHLDTSC
jgi:hypothetical protein